MALPWMPSRTKLGTAVGLAALAAISLGMVPVPPPDPLFGSLVGFLGRALAAPVQGFTLAYLTGVMVLIVAVAVSILIAYLKGGRVNVRENLFYRLAATCLAYGLIALAFFIAKSTQGEERTQVEPASITSPQLDPACPPLPAPVPAARHEFLPEDPQLPILLASMMILAGAGAVLLMMRRKRPVLDATLPAVSPLASARRRLELGDHVRDAIIACYAEMCSVFKEQFPAVPESLTAREFASFLRAHGASEPEIASLTSVFEKARYSMEPCHELERALARDALLAIEGRYGSPGAAS